MSKVSFEIYSTERGKKVTDEILRSVFDLDDTGHIWKH